MYETREEIAWLAMRKRVRGRVGRCAKVRDAVVVVEFIVSWAGDGDGDGDGKRRRRMWKGGLVDDVS
jgi:hypothetical protein